MMTRVDGMPPVPIWGGTPICAMESDVFYAVILNDADAIRIDIVRKDMKDGITWDQLQQIKTDCGFGDLDGVEFYPPDRDVFNTGNVRHLFVVKIKLPLIRRSGIA